MEQQRSRSWDNNFLEVRPSTGLEVDGHIFAQIMLPYHTKIEHRAWIDVMYGRKKVRIFLEHIHKEHLVSRNWFMINQELATKEDLTLFPHMEVVICKTNFAFELVNRFKRQHQPDANYDIFFLGFTSIIRPVSNQFEMDYNKALHLAGASWMKGTVNLLNAWARHAEWPVLVTLCRTMCFDSIRGSLRKIRKHNKGKLPANMIVLTDLVPFGQVLEYLETCGVQILTSDAEGWGHYIQEARAHEALCVYTDYPPMSEFFKPNQGVGIGAGRPIRMDGDLPGNDGFRVSEKGIEDAIERVVSMPIRDRKKMGRAAARQFYKDRLDFLRRADELRTKI